MTDFDHNKTKMIRWWKPKRTRKGRSCNRCSNCVQDSLRGWHNAVSEYELYEFLCPSCSAKHGIPVEIWTDIFSL